MGDIRAAVFLQTMCGCSETGIAVKPKAGLQSDTWEMERDIATCRVESGKEGKDGKTDDKSGFTDRSSRKL